jgi:membrane-associated phospholipid phosphatase
MVVRTFFRGFPLFITIFSLLEGLFLSDIRGIYLFIYNLISLWVNMFLKEMMRILTGKMGERPEGAGDCGVLFPGRKNFEIFTFQEGRHSYGMPSGHAQGFAFVSVMLAFSLYKNRKNDYYVPLKIGALFVMTVVAMYMRVTVEGCHTPFQVIVGALIGFLLAVFFEKYFINPFDPLMKKCPRV